MTITAARLIAGSTLSSGQVTLYTAPALNTAVIKSAVVANPSTVTSVKISVYIVPSGGSVTSSNVVIAGVTVAPSTDYNCPELVNQVLPAGSFLSASDGAGIASINASGYTIS